MLGGIGGGGSAPDATQPTINGVGSGGGLNETELLPSDRLSQLETTLRLVSTWRRRGYRDEIQQELENRLRKAME